MVDDPKNIMSPINWYSHFPTFQTMLIPLELVILVAGIAALIFSAITLNSLEKIKTSCGTALSKKQYDTARNLQIAQLIVSALVVILSGWVVASAASHKAFGKSLPGASRISQYAKGIFG